MQATVVCVGFLIVVVIGCGSSGSGGALPDAGSAGSGGGSSGSGANAGSSGNDASLGGAGGAGGGAGTPSGGMGGGGGFASDAGLMLGPADIACAQQGSADACISCCSKAHASWSTVAPATRACVCENPGACDSECAGDYCLEQAGSPSCYACIFPTLVPGAACYAPSQAICAGDPDCLTYVDCRANCVLKHPGN